MWDGDPLSGRVLHFGIREHAMGAIMNGIAVHGGTRVFGGTFLTFSDYMRPAVRLASVMQLPGTYVWTHDSIGLGEDGPTPQAAADPRAPWAVPRRTARHASPPSPWPPFGRSRACRWSGPPTPTRPPQPGGPCSRTPPDRL